MTDGSRVARQEEIYNGESAEPSYLQPRLLKGFQLIKR